MRAGAANVSFPGDGWPVQEHAASPKHRLQDASQAAVYTLEEWVIPNPTGETPHAFAFYEVTELHAWVSLLANGLPSSAEGGGQHLVPALAKLKGQLMEHVTAVEAANGRRALCLSEWKAWMKSVRHALEEDLAEKILPTLCRTETCRIWTLLHILSVSGLARGNATVTAASRFVHSSSGKERAVNANAQVIDAIIAFLRRYFTCQSCRGHFLEQVAAGAYGLEVARSGGPVELVLWWWHLHSDVSARVAKEGKCKADRRWPPADLCGACWQESANENSVGGGTDPVSSWKPDEAAVSREMARLYWPLPPQQNNHQPQPVERTEE